MAIKKSNVSVFFKKKLFMQIPLKKETWPGAIKLFTPEL
jgi:hypothetical protein